VVGFRGSYEYLLITVAHRKDNVDLIWGIAQLSGLFEKKTNLGGFLQDVVDLIAQHMESDVCSVYLYDAGAAELILRATKGLAPDAPGRVSLRLGEGITGTALKELRPIRAERASKNPNFKAIPGIDEEQYESFLAVPIKQGVTRIGVIVLQHRRAARFDRQDVRAVQAIAGQLAATLENAEILMEVHTERKSVESADVCEPVVMLPARSVCEGYAEGLSVVFGAEGDRLVGPLDEEESVAGALSRFQFAFERSLAQLDALQKEMEANFADVASLIFSSHLLMLKDDEFGGAIRSAIESGTPPAKAVIEVVEMYASVFSGSRSGRVQEKIQDVRDLGHRILRNLAGQGEQVGDYQGQIIIAHTIFPSELVKIAAQHAEGIILGEGEVTAHISILGRSMEIPIVVTRDTRVFRIPDGSHLIVDADEGRVLVNPDEDQTTAIRRRQEYRIADAGPSVIPEISHTADGIPISVYANINLLHDVVVAVENRAQGIGLYRSEFPFLVRNDFPSEEEQYGIYRRVVSSMEGAEVTLRTLDIGGDKMPFGDLVKETNPFLGLRGIRFSLHRVEVFKEQIRAMLRAGRDASLRVMFPMISSLDEYRAAKQVVLECSRELSEEGVPHNEKPLLGAMIELPSAVAVSQALAREADFLSIGSNDLVMYTLGVDRTNEQVAWMYSHYHPAVLKSLATIARAASRCDTDLSICGEVASDSLLVPFLIGIGVRKLSVDPKRIGNVKARVQEVDSAQARELAESMLALESIAEVSRAVGIDSG
jgi:phosphotransferase system enzyme I (PtsP)